MNGESQGLPLVAQTHGVSTIRDIVGFLFKHLGLLIGVWIGVVGLVTLFIYLFPLPYGATSVVLIEHAKSPTLRSDVVVTPVAMVEVISSEMEIIKSRGVAETVVERLGLDQGTPRDSWPRRVKTTIVDTLDRAGLLSKLSVSEGAIRGVQNGLKIRQPPQSNLLDITYYADDPERAAAIALAVTEVYIERHRAIFANNTQSFFEDRVSAIERELAEARAATLRETDRSEIQKLQLHLRGLEQSYLYFRSQLDQARSDAAADASLVNVRLVDKPSIPTRTRFSRLMLILLAIVAGALMAVALALLREYFDHRVYGPRDLHGRVEVSVLGTVRRARAARRVWRRARPSKTTA